MTLPISVSPGDAVQDLQAAYLELKAQAHTETYRLCVKWIDALIVAQQSHMATCNPSRLEVAQTRLKQLVAQRNALAAPGGASTGHSFD